jgi:RNA ligase (TIGR02306 family)
MRQLATIQTIAEVQPIPNADAIEKVRVLDWWCVAKKAEFRAGDLCVYFEIDSLLPSSNPAFAFLAKGSKESKVALGDGTFATGYRLRTIRLRGQISQGLALPLATVELPPVPVGTDVSEALGVIKWEPPPSRYLSANARGPFPSFIPKTDEERVQNLGDVVRRHAGETFCVTEKLDGTSVTFYRTAERFGVCSRNQDLLDGNIYWEAARAYSIEEKLPVGFAIQGEIIGQSIQGNPLNRRGQEFYAFNVYDIRDFCDERGIPRVPVVDEAWVLPDSVVAIVDAADGKSLLSPACDREGIVIRPLVEAREEMRGGIARLSFKAISNRYLLNDDSR